MLTGIALMALINFAYDIEVGKTYEACYQQVGSITEVCNSMTVSPYVATVLDDTQYDFYVKVDGTPSKKTRHTTSPPFYPAPTIVELPTQ